MAAGLVTGLIAPILKPILRPVTRVIVGLVAIPLFRLFRRRVVRIQELNEELEKDIDQWFARSVILLFVTAEMEQILFQGWIERVSRWDGDSVLVESWITLALRLIMAIGVIEGMPDQMLFAVIHPGLRRVKFEKGIGFFKNLWRQKKNIALGAICQHLNRSSPVFAILSTLLYGPLGWTFYGLAIGQYLIIGLVTSRDRAMDVLSEFDRRVAERRQELIEELDLPGKTGQSTGWEQTPVEPDEASSGKISEIIANPAATTLLETDK
jgi:hypothetical protein